MGHTERYRMRGTINKIAQRVVSVVQFSLETYPAHFLLQPFLVTMGDEGLQVVCLSAMKDAVDGVMAGDVFDLTSAEVIAGSQLKGSIG